MKKTLVLALAGLFFQADLRGDALTLTADNLEVVIDSSAQPTLRLAADEMTNYLSRVFLKPIPLVSVEVSSCFSTAMTCVKR